MVRLYLSDLLKRCNYNLNKTILILHGQNHERFVNAYREDSLREYTQKQSPGFFNQYEKVIVFAGDEGTTAKYLKSYEVRHGEEYFISPGCATFLLEPYKDEVMHPLFEIVDDPLLSYENKLFIEWGKGAINWKQKATNEKVVTKLINTNELAFPGFEKVLLTYGELKEIIDDRQTYTHWHNALNSINAIYVITDCSSGKHYVGSSYNKQGLLGRWTEYVTTLHGKNKGLIELLKQKPLAHLQFQFSILKLLPKDVTETEAIDIEKEYKRKLQTVKFGYNQN